MAIMPDWEAHVPAALAEELRAHHDGAGRAYHSWHHLEELLVLLAEIEPRLHQPRAVLFAVLFHDAVYDPRSSDNERSSAELLAARARDVLAPGILAHAERMVLATVGHAVPEGLSDTERADLAHFLDMDLAILGAAPARFAEYEEQIRQEYSHIPDDAYRAARAAILARLGAREPLYFSDWGREKFEAQARENLGQLVARLRAKPAVAG